MVDLWIIKKTADDEFVSHDNTGKTADDNTERHSLGNTKKIGNN